jgi:hypothetical protein
MELSLGGDGVNQQALVRYLASVRVEVFQCSFLFLSSSSTFQPVYREAGWAAVPGGRFSNSPTSQSPIVSGKRTAVT